MEFLKKNRRFDFLYGGKAFEELEYEVSQKEEGNVLTTTYLLPDGLKITNIATKFDNAYEWVNWFENTSDQPTGVISALYDACITLPIVESSTIASPEDNVSVSVTKTSLS